jgi:hypothetical protein
MKSVMNAREEWNAISRRVNIRPIAEFGIADLIRHVMVPQCLCTKFSELLLCLTVIFMPIEGIMGEYLVNHIFDAVFNTSMRSNGTVDSEMESVLMAGRGPHAERRHDS